MSNIFCERKVLINKVIGKTIETCYEYFKSINYLPTITPITTNSVSSPMGKGSDSLPVQINLFDQDTYLADSMQFNLEYLLRLYSPGVWYIMPTFRGEDPDETHLNQFIHIESELVGDLAKVMEVVEQLVKKIVNTILVEKLCDQISNKYLKDFQKIIKFERVTFQEFKKNFPFEKYPNLFKSFSDGSLAISREGEIQLSKFVGGPCWLTNPEYSTVPFYQAKLPGTKYALSADLILDGCEIAGCGQRWVSDKETLNALLEHDVQPEPYQWYLNLKRDCPLQTSGFGIGLERLMAWVLQEKDIRNIPLFSRLKSHVSYP